MAHGVAHCAAPSLFILTVGVAGLNVVLEGAGLVLELGDGGVLLAEGVLHLAHQLRLDLLELLDVALGLLAQFDVGGCDAHVIIRGGTVVVVAVLLLLAPHGVLRVVLRGGLLVGAVLVRHLLLEEALVRRLQEIIQVGSRVVALVKDLLLVRLNVLEVCVLGVLVLCVLALDAERLHLGGHLLVVVVLLLAAPHIVRELAILVGHFDLLLEFVLFEFELAHAVFQQEFLHLGLLEQQLLGVLVRGRHVGDCFAGLGRDLVVQRQRPKP